LGNRFFTKDISMKRSTNIVTAVALGMLAAGGAAVAQQVPVQGIKAQPTAPPGITYGGPAQTPWFGDQDVREQFKLSNDQYKVLSKAYGEAWAHYNSGLGQLGNGLTEAQRAQKMRDLQAAFYQSVNGSVDRLISDPQQRQRYNQLHLQYQGYAAFNDPTIQQKLNLSNEQRQKLAQYGQEWNQQMSALHQAYQTDPIGTTNRYHEMVKQNNQRFNSVLNQQQQQAWQQMTGASFNFPPGVYFQRAGGQ
jgi:hypothetical protein